MLNLTLNHKLTIPILSGVQILELLFGKEFISLSLSISFVTLSAMKFKLMISYNLSKSLITTLILVDFYHSQFEIA